jgi:hypothetical protein
MQRHHKHEVTRWQAVNKKAQPFSGQANAPLRRSKCASPPHSTPLANIEKGGSQIIEFQVTI